MGLETCTGNVAVNYFNCITTAGMKHLAITMYGPACMGRSHADESVEAYRGEIKTNQ